MFKKGDFMSIDEIKELDIKERIILMNDIWATLENEEQNIASPSWHKDILKERISTINNDKAKYISLDDLKSI